MFDRLGELSDTWLEYRELAALLVVVVAILLARALGILFCRGIEQACRRAQLHLDEHVIRHVQLSGSATVIIAGLALTPLLLGLPPRLTFVILRILGTLLLLIWFRAAFAACRLVFEAITRWPRRFSWVEPQTMPLLDMTTKVVMTAVAGYLVLVLWDIDPTAWLASAGVLGVVVGLAARDTLANLFGGFSIVADAPYRIGDVIRLDTGERGRVTRVGIRSTRLLTRDDVEITIPNAVIASVKIVNESGGPYRKTRIRMPVGVAYGSDPQLVIRLLQEVGSGHSEVAESPEPRVRMRAFGDSSLDFEMLCWIKDPERRGRVAHELNLAIHMALADHEIEIPFPKRDLYVRELPARRATSGAYVS